MPGERVVVTVAHSNPANSLGVGLGYRSELDELLSRPRLVDWIEIISEHYMGNLAAAEHLMGAHPDMPIVPHGVNMSIGTIGNDPEWHKYVDSLAELSEFVNAPWFSDHLCFTHSGDSDIGTLTPLPRTRDVIRHVAERARKAQEIVGKPFLLENIAYHVSWGDNMNESEFVSRVIEESGCYLLLDLTNLLYNGRNHRYDPDDFLDSLPLDRVMQVHLAGGTESDGIFYDTHSHPVPDDVWDLLSRVLQENSKCAAMVERDKRLGETAEIELDLQELRRVMPGCQSA